MKLLRITAVIAFFLFACRHLGRDESAVKSVPPPPKPGEAPARLAKDKVYDAMVAIRKTFYQEGTIYTVLEKDSAQKDILPPESEPNRCLNVCPPDRWSDLVCHYYCQFPSYSRVVPNIRSCFSTAAKTLPSYEDAYDFCVYQDFDVVLPGKNQVAYDAKIIAANKALTPPVKPGVMKWVDENQKDIFKYVMFTNGNLNAFDRNDRREVINKFYDVHLQKEDYTSLDFEDVDECFAKRPALLSEPVDGTHCSSLISKAPAFPTAASWPPSVLFPTSASWPGPVITTAPTPTSGSFILKAGVYQLVGTSCELNITTVNSGGGQTYNFNGVLGTACSSTVALGVSPGANWSVWGCSLNSCTLKTSLPGGAPVQITSPTGFFVQPKANNTWIWVRP